jgi:cellulose synthase operon protein C
VLQALMAASQSPGSDVDAISKGLWYAAELQFQAFKRIPSEDLEKKAGALQQLEALYTQAASLGSAEWSVAALWRMGMAYSHLGQSLKTAAAPAELSPEEADQWRDAFKQQSVALLARADETLKLCTTRADELGVYTTGALGCRKREESVEVRSVSASAGGEPALTEELVRATEGNQDPAAIETLGLAYLAAGKVPLAQLTLSRAVELGGIGRAQNALGFANLILGDASSASAMYEKALAGPSRDRARANLAALKCRFGDAEGARKELAKIKDTEKLQGPDLDSQWRACR